jgi:hypothetical protein
VPSRSGPLAVRVEQVAQEGGQVVGLFRRRLLELVEQHGDVARVDTEVCGQVGGRGHDISRKRHCDVRNQLRLTGYPVRPVTRTIISTSPDDRLLPVPGRIQRGSQRCLLLVDAHRSSPLLVLASRYSC